MKKVPSEKREKEKDFQLKASMEENLKLRQELLQKNKTVTKTYSLFWFGFFTGIIALVIIYFGLKYLNKKFNILAYLNKTKLS